MSEPTEGVGEGPVADAVPEKPVRIKRVTFTIDGVAGEIGPSKPVDLVWFERITKLSAAALEDRANLKFEYICILIWSQLRRTDRIPRSQQYDDRFLESIDDLNAEVEEIVDPQPQEASTTAASPPEE